MHACGFGLTRPSGFRIGQQDCIEDFTIAISETFDASPNPSPMAEQFAENSGLVSGHCFSGAASAENQ
jgi:hypothetical protein